MMCICIHINIIQPQYYVIFSCLQPYTRNSPIFTTLNHIHKYSEYSTIFIIFIDIQDIHQYSEYSSIFTIFNHICLYSQYLTIFNHIQSYSLIFTYPIIFNVFEYEYIHWTQISRVVYPSIRAIPSLPCPRRKSGLSDFLLALSSLQLFSLQITSQVDFAAQFTFTLPWQTLCIMLPVILPKR